MKRSRFEDTYFDSSSRANRRFGYLRFFPKFLVDWYAKTIYLAQADFHENFEFFVPNPDGKKILDIGFGEGRFMAYCGKDNVVGVDVWPPGLKKMRASGFNVAFADATKRLPFKDNAFDGVYCSHVIEHVIDGTTLVREVSRVLKRGGRFIIRTMDFSRSYRDFYSDYTHVHPYTKTSLFKLLEDNGYAVKRVANGFYHSNFFLRRIEDALVIFPPRWRRLIINLLCPLFSWEIYAIAVKRA